MMSVLKASTALAKEIKIERLLQVLMHIILENLSAQIGYFILLQENKVLFADRESKKEESLEEGRLLGPDRIPDSMLQFVKRTHENLVVVDSKKGFSIFHGTLFYKE